MTWRNEVSVHGDPAVLYPFFSGFADETGTGPGLGFNLNVPLPPGTGAKEYRPALAAALGSAVRTATCAGVQARMPVARRKVPRQARVRTVRPADADHRVNEGGPGGRRGADVRACARCGAGAAGGGRCPGARGAGPPPGPPRPAAGAAAP